MRIVKPIHWRSRPVAILFVIFAVWLSGAFPAFSSDVDKPLLNNGDFARGSGDSCDGWRTDGWIQSPDTTIYTWHPAELDKPAELEVNTLHDNDARWVQTITLSQGWYYLSVQARTENVSKYFVGATISILEDGIMSADLKETHDWQRIGLYLRVGPQGGDVDVALRLGGYMNLTRGRALFRDASVIRVAGPPAGELHVFDLEQIRKSEVAGPIGQTWSLVAVFLVLFAWAAAGWWAFGTTFAPPVPARSRRRGIDAA
jgi:hypothetical protein